MSEVTLHAAPSAAPAGRAGSYGLPIALALCVAAFAWVQPAFLSPDNLVGILRQVAIIGVMAGAMTFVIMTGGIDLSIGPVLALAGLLAVLALDAGLGLAPALAIALAAGALVGALNGVLIAYGALPPIIVTLATLGVVRGTALLIGGPDLHGVRAQAAYSFIGTGSVLGLPFSVWLFLGLSGLLVFAHAAPRWGCAWRPSATTNGRRG